jgi:HEPN domain-containing protein
MYLGIHDTTKIVYEGDSKYGAHHVLPIPLLLPAKFSPTKEIRICPDSLDTHGMPKMLFREDSFDPVTRIRRGRFYKQSGDQPSQWHVMMSPPFVASAGLEPQRVFTFESCSSPDFPPLSDAEQQLIVLGSTNGFSIWTILSKECIHSREFFVTLKSRQSLGVLPEIDWSKIPDKNNQVRGKIESLLDDIYRAGPESVVDRTREAATAILSTYLQDQGVEEAKGEDIGNLIKLLNKKNGENCQRIVACAAEIPQRLHSRGKNAEQEARENLRILQEQDAELAVRCIGVMLCDLGWAVWR